MSAYGGYLQRSLSNASIAGDGASYAERGVSHHSRTAHFVFWAYSVADPILEVENDSYPKLTETTFSKK